MRSYGENDGSLDVSRGMWTGCMLASQLQSPQLGHSSVTNGWIDVAVTAL